MLTHIVDGRVVVNLLQVDTVDSWAFLDLFLEELQRVVLWHDTSQTHYSRSCHAMSTDKKKKYKAYYDDECKLHVQLVLKNLAIKSLSYVLSVNEHISNNSN